MPAPAALTPRHSPCGTPAVLKPRGVPEEEGKHGENAQSPGLPDSRPGVHGDFVQRSPASTGTRDAPAGGSACVHAEGAD